MGARRFEDLVAWQLSEQLREEVFAFTSQLPASRDFKYCDQIRESSRSGPRNIAEGFGRYYHPEFQRFLRIAVASLQENKNHLQDGLKRGHVSPSHHLRLHRLNLRALKACTRLICRLKHTEAPEPFSDLR